MAPRKYHLAAGIIIYAAFSTIFYYWLLSTSYYVPASLFGITDIPVIILNRTLSSADIIYLAIALLLVLTGAEIADYDKAIMWMQHRDWLTHSFILPTIFAAIVMIFTSIQIGNPYQAIFYNPRVNSVLLIGMASFVLGAASHLFLDYFPPIKVEELTSKRGSLEAGYQMADFYIAEMTAKELFRRLQGTALVHFWWAIAMPKEQKNKKSKVQKYEMKKTLDSKRSQQYYLANGLLLMLVAGLLLLQYFLIEFSSATQQLILLLI
ncbi:MAG: hypothetical protein ACUVXA_15015 [Candidatus Jordarchaeum sp.]|uniref:hypothetical protein n=1 Tax=Candidatus Jordarchaeum sp. TaxID=2823881 RepID=UPI0040491FBC